MPALVAPPGPASVPARIAVARLLSESDELYQTVLPTSGGEPFRNLWAFGDMPLTSGRRFWDRVRPHVLRYGDSDIPAPYRALIYVVRQGREEADYAALCALVEQNGPRFDAPVIQLFDWMGAIGRGQVVAMLPAETENSEAATND